MRRDTACLEAQPAEAGLSGLQRSYAEMHVNLFQETVNLLLMWVLSDNSHYVLSADKEIC